MISFGNGWNWDRGRFSHSCGPELSTSWSGERACECGMPAPRHARSFRRWLKRQTARSARGWDTIELAAHSDPQNDPGSDLHNPTYRT